MKTIGSRCLATVTSLEEEPRVRAWVGESPHERRRSLDVEMDGVLELGQAWREHENSGRGFAERKYAAGTVRRDRLPLRSAPALGNLDRQHIARGFPPAMPEAVALEDRRMDHEVLVADCEELLAIT